MTTYIFITNSHYCNAVYKSTITTLPFKYHNLLFFCITVMRTDGEMALIVQMVKKKILSVIIYTVIHLISLDFCGEDK